MYKVLFHLVSAKLHMQASWQTLALVSENIHIAQHYKAHSSVNPMLTQLKKLLPESNELIAADPLYPGCYTVIKILVAKSYLHFTSCILHTL